MQVMKSVGKTIDIGSWVNNYWLFVRKVDFGAYWFTPNQAFPVPVISELLAAFDALSVQHGHIEPPEVS